MDWEGAQDKSETGMRCECLRLADVGSVDATVLVVCSDLAFLHLLLKAVVHHAGSAASAGMATYRRASIVVDGLFNGCIHISNSAG